jgi:hypothetical protein
MSVPEKNLSRALGFKPAVVRKSSEVYVEYYIVNPLDHSWNRKRILLNHIGEKKTERIKYAEKLAMEINRKLENGWNPFIEHEAPKAYTSMREALDTFLKSRERELRPATYRMYKSFIVNFYSWAVKYFKSDMFYVVQVNKLCATSFMQYILVGRDVSLSTFNNYLTGMNSIFNWLQYCPIKIKGAAYFCSP